MKKKIAIIGAGFSGLSAAAFLAHQGMDVTIYEKNSMPGGRARILQADGFTFDMGPTWYWLPDVLESFFEQFNKKPIDYYRLKRLDPSYRVYFGKNDFMDIPANLEKLKILFESIEEGSATKLEKLLADAELKYKLGIKKLIYKPSLSIWEFFEPWLFRGIVRMDFFRSVSVYLKSLFRDPRLIQILEFPVIFLGSTPSRIPALYTLMNYADIVLGTWYPEGGMHSVALGMYHLALEQNVKFEFNSTISKIEITEEKAKGLWVNKTFVDADVILATADYHHVETELLSEEYRSYSSKYWDTRVMAPSALLYYLGVSRKVDGIEHHNLFFDEDFNLHTSEIYDRPQWPSKPVLYLSCSSKTEASVAPEGHENLIVLIPVAPGLKDTKEIRDKYLEIFLERLQNLTGENIKNDIIFTQSYAQSNFIDDYNSFKGNAYGLSNTLRQSAIFKPSLKSRKVNNLFYAGQLTVPGPGVPPCIISGQVAATEILKRI